jgi:hypothetical protein
MVDEYFTPVFTAVNAAAARAESALIHCGTGAHRAGAVGVAVLMRISAPVASAAAAGSDDHECSEKNAAATADGSDGNRGWVSQPAGAATRFAGYDGVVDAARRRRPVLEPELVCQGSAVHLLRLLETSTGPTSYSCTEFGVGASASVIASASDCKDIAIEGCITAGVFDSATDIDGGVVTVTVAKPAGPPFFSLGGLFGRGNQTADPLQAMVQRMTIAIERGIPRDVVLRAAVMRSGKRPLDVERMLHAAEVAATELVAANNVDNGITPTIFPDSHTATDFDTDAAAGTGSDGTCDTDIDGNTDVDTCTTFDFNSDTTAIQAPQPLPIRAPTPPQTQATAPLLMQTTAPLPIQALVSLLK